MTEIFRPVAADVEPEEQVVHPEILSMIRAGVEIAAQPVDPLALDWEDYNERQNISWDRGWD